MIFAVDRVVKHFYDGFKVAHAAFEGAVGGIPDAAMQRWYTSVTLNRLMFAYFIQPQGLLDGDADYLRHHLDRSVHRGDDRFYRDCLCPLFFDGFATPVACRGPDVSRVLGNVPYLSGGLFLPHRIEQQYGDQIQISDAAFVRLLNFFDRYHWQLDDRPGHNDSALTPDVLGFIFEKYINQKQTGAYYTNADITGYIARSSIIPRLFDTVEAAHPHAFAANGPLWDVLQRAPERYLYADVQHGTALPLPAAIAAGISDVAQRSAWNQPAPAAYALPTEIWREVVARRERHAALVAKLCSGAVQSINALITDNLDLGVFAQDVLATTTDPEFLLGFWRALAQLSVLDPTCGAGAFLVAALHVLQPLYATCLERMAALLGDATRRAAPTTATLDTMRAVLARAHQQHNPTYFTLKSIIVNNLYGVDLMEEAVEICKLRLFLKLAAQSEYDATKTNLKAQPLSDIDFNIYSGNALVGYATYDQLRQAVTSTRAAQAPTKRDSVVPQLDAQMEQIDHWLQRVRQTHSAEDGRHGSDKQVLHGARNRLTAALDRHLASAYGVNSACDAALHVWQASHAPLHWFVSFYRVMQQHGGFDVIIGNPPYVGYTNIALQYTVRGYATERCANLYAFIAERSLALLRAGGRYGMIVPIASVSTEGMRELQALYGQQRQWHSHWAVRPGKLFAGVDMNLTITLLQKTCDPAGHYTTGYRRWSSGPHSDRPQLFTTINYVPLPGGADHTNRYPKLGSTCETDVLAQMLSHGRKLRHYADPTGETLYYHSGGRYWRKALPTKLSSHYKPVQIPRPLVPIVFALLNSQLFYWYWISNSNCMDVVAREVLGLPVFSLEAADTNVFQCAMDDLLAAYAASTTTRVRRGAQISGEEINFDVQRAKPIIDRIDTHLARCYGFSDVALDFILNYDIKYRSGRDIA